jgi:hypothetical protein
MAKPYLGSKRNGGENSKSLINNGGYGWTRTTDLSIMSAAL